MVNTNENEYDECRYWIQAKRKKGSSWEEILLACKSDERGLEKFLEEQVDNNDWPGMDKEVWKQLVTECQSVEGEQEPFYFKGNDGALFDHSKGDKFVIPRYSHSLWQVYKSSLNWNKKSIEDIENATIGILNRLSLDTRESGPVKGLVVGHVQSGKTANMEALMSMAADSGWNFFIILSGTIESLRIQTFNRMKNDLNRPGKNNLNWIYIDHPSKYSDGSTIFQPRFEEGSNLRYFTVCLKNKKRLEDLIDWIHYDLRIHEQMKILIIDDEADQAGISNTAVNYNKSTEEKDRKGINKLIVNLVNDEHYKKNKSRGKANAVNYVMYTATPYANFLNESSETSLYPSSFIWTLKTSNEYIGPEQIFGTDNPEDDGIDMKRVVPSEDVYTISDIYNNTSTEIPESLKDAICWFICAVSVMRYWDYKKPISMLIHTSQKQKNHQAIAEAVSEWINKEIIDPKFIDTCRIVYENEITELSKEKWFEQFPNYGMSQDFVKDYPSFDVIIPYMRQLLSENMQYIKMDDDGELKYSKGLHLVIDNCSNNRITDENEHIRLAYPDPNMDPYPSPAPAFIVIGGSTLARGLTIEGLVSTYFLRASCQADTLMQMGRWFGFRKGYELLPRIWMTEDTINKFRFLSILETDMRTDLKKYMIAGVSPSEYGPRIKNSPRLSWLRLTSKKHMTNAQNAEMDFSGAKPQTTIFDDDETIQKENIQITEKFIDGLPGDPVVSFDKTSLFWKKITVDYIKDKLLIDKFHFCQNSRAFNEIKSFCDWIKEIDKADEFNEWDVIIAGRGEISDKVDESHWECRGYNLGKVVRSRKKTIEATDVIDIGALRSLKDHIDDIEDLNLLKNVKISTQEQVDKIRKEDGKDRIPFLLIYRIDAKSKKRDSAANRESLNRENDIIGLQIVIPGEEYSMNHCRKVSVILTKNDKEDEVDNV